MSGRTGRHGHALDDHDQVQVVLPPVPRPRPAPPAPRPTVVPGRRGPLVVRRSALVAYVLVLVVLALATRQWFALAVPALILWGVYRASS